MRGAAFAEFHQVFRKVSQAFWFRLLVAIRFKQFNCNKNGYMYIHV